MNLNDIDKKEPFKAPDGYFESLEDRIMARIEENEASPARGRSVWFQPWYGYAAAAAVALIAVVMIFSPGSVSESASAEDILAEIPEEAIIDYLASSSISTDEIMDLANFTLEEADEIQSENTLELNEEDIDLLIEEFMIYELDSNML